MEINNKSYTKSRGSRMLKNTIFLYLRMFVIMIINLITVRVLLSALGQTDYGLYNVVGGVVTMLAFISTSMSSAAQRFFAFYLGKDDKEQLNRVFRVSLLIFILIALVMVPIAETIGLWFVKNKLTIPIDRYEASLWVYQFAIISFCINLLVVPFRAMVLSTERMDFFAVITMIESLMKLGIVFFISGEIQQDKLILYSMLFTMITLFNYLAYAFFVRIKNRYLSFIPLFDRLYFGHLFSYCGWYMYGTIAKVIRGQGINMLLNIFFNPIVNAARALAYQVNSAVDAFVTSFYSAVRPQIIKRFAAEETESLHNLVFRATSLSYYLVLLISVPLIIWMPEILGLWLKEVPEYTVLFTRLVIINTMIETLGLPLTTSVCADGNIKWFQIVTGTLLLFNLPISYIFLKLGYSPEVTIIIAIVISCIVQLAKMQFAKSAIRLDLAKYYILLLRLLVVSAISFAIPFVINIVFATRDLWQMGLLIFVSISIITLVIFFVGLTSSDRRMLKSLILKKHE